MPKFIVQAVKREGFEHVWRGGRAWPSSQPVEVEVVDEEECPTVTIEESGRKARTALHPTKIGQKKWATIMRDGRLSKTPVGFQEAVGETSDLKRRVAGLESEFDSHAKERRLIEKEFRSMADELARAKAQVTSMTTRAEKAERALEDAQRAAPAAPAGTEESPAPAQTEISPPAETVATAPSEKRSRR